MSRDGDSPDALSRVPPTDVDPDTLAKLKQQVNVLCIWNYGTYINYVDKLLGGLN